MGIVRARTVQFNLKIASLVCKGASTSHLHTRAISGKFSATCARWFVWYTNIMMHLVVARRVEWLRYGQYQFEMGIVRERTVKFNLKIASLVCKGA